MNIRRLALTLFTVAAIAGATIGAALASPRDQDEPSAAPTHGEDQPGAYLGVAATELTETLKERFGLPEDIEGLVVRATVPGSPADDADLRRGDILLNIDDTVLKTPRQLQRFLNSKAPGDVVVVTYFRDDARAEVRIELAALPRVAPELPRWLKEVRHFVRQFPNAVDDSLRVLSDDGEVKEYTLTLGTIVGVSGNIVGVENKLGEAERHEVVDRTVIVYRNHRLPVERLAEGMKVAVIEVDDVLKAIVVLHPAPADADARADRADVFENVQKHVIEELRERLNNGRSDAAVKRPERDGQQGAPAGVGIELDYTRLGAAA